MQQKLKRLSKQTEIFQRLRMIIFKGNLKVNLPLTFKSNNFGQNNPSNFLKKHQRGPPNFQKNFRPPPNINFRPHPKNTPHPRTDPTHPVMHFPRPPHNSRAPPHPPKPNLNHFIISQNPSNPHSHGKTCLTSRPKQHELQTKHPRTPPQLPQTPPKKSPLSEAV